MSVWPDGFNFEDDDICQRIFKPFIEKYMAQLAALDAQRPAGIHYIFHEHARRVAKDVEQTCLKLGLGETVARNMYWATLPHDIGKARLPAEIWDTQEKPSDELKALRRTHTILGTKIVDEDLGEIDHPFKELMRDIMLNHHEQMDGEGTHGLPGDQLSAPVRLASIVEAFDGWSIPRPHFGDRDISPAGVLKRMRTEKLHMFDEALFTAFETTKLAEQ